jgi:hypothetical protein
MPAMHGYECCKTSEHAFQIVDCTMVVCSEHRVLTLQVSLSARASSLMWARR